MPDFSYAGYQRGGVALPRPAQVFTTIVPPASSKIINEALDAAGAVAAPGNPQVVQLVAGTYPLTARLRIARSNVILRGAGQGPDGTVLFSQIATAHHAILVGPSTTVVDAEPYPAEIANTRSTIVSTSVPVGTRMLDVQCPTSTPCFTSFDPIAPEKSDVIVVRTPNQTWLDDKAMNAAHNVHWTTTDFVGMHPRRVMAITGLGGTTFRLVLDIPLVDPIDSVYGGGYVAKAKPVTFTEGVGVEDLRIDSLAEDTSITDNDWNGVTFLRTKNSFVRRVTVERYADSAVSMEGWSSFNTVEEVAHIEIKSPHHTSGSRAGLPVSRHRYSFNVSEGHGNLFQRCLTVASRHSFVTGGLVAGPNVWLDCLALGALADDGPHQRWATGLLFDNVASEDSDVYLDSAGQDRVSDAGLHVQNAGDGGESSGHGWTGAQVMFWNSEGALISDAPPGAMNWVVGGISSKNPGKEPANPGIWQLNNGQVRPRSLYLAQLEDRLGSSAVANVTTSSQRSGRIWNALRVWLGNSALSATPTATCSSNRQSGRTCCNPSCTQCGGSNCNGAGPPGECCNGGIFNLHRSCTQVPPPCEIPDPTCQSGTLVGGLCCPSSCSSCTTGTCTTSCCTTLSEGRSCEDFPAPCRMPDRCTSGLPGMIVALPPNGMPTGPEICCAASCNQCGGPGCGASPNTAAGCCAGDIAAANVSCSGASPPCVVN